MATKKKQVTQYSQLSKYSRFELIDDEGDCIDSYDTLEEVKAMIKELAEDYNGEEDDVNFYVIEKVIVGVYTIPKPEVKVTYKVVKK